MPPRRKRPYHHGNLREALLGAAERLLEREGPSSLVLRRIAADAGVSHAACYHHFASREALLRGLAAHGFQRFGAALREAAGARPGVEGFAEMGVAYVRFAAEHPALFRVLFGPEAAERHADPEVAAAADAAFAGLVRMAESAGPGSAEEIRRRALGAWAVVHGLASLLVDGQLGRLGLDLSQHEAAARALLAGAPMPPAPAIAPTPPSRQNRPAATGRFPGPRS
jgi:AcrR family transcriptional regulator